MNIYLKKFSIKLLIVALVMLAFGAIAFKFFLSVFYMPLMLWALPFFFLVTLGVHAYQLKMVKTNPAKFTRVSMVMTFVKLLIYSLFTIISLAISTQNAIAFVLVVMVLYVVFTVTEVTDLMKIVRSTGKDN